MVAPVTLTVGRVSYTEQQREGLLDEFERSGLKGAQFAQAAGVKYQTFAYWVQRRRHARGDYQDKGGLRLLEAVVAGPAPASRPEPAGVAGGRDAVLEVHLPGGVQLTVATQQEAVLAAQLIRALAAASPSPC